LGRKAELQARAICVDLAARLPAGMAGVPLDFTTQASNARSRRSGHSILPRPSNSTVIYRQPHLAPRSLYLRVLYLGNLDARRP
jgi:hypothetical protein